jgi:hypothetical protein
MYVPTRAAYAGSSDEVTNSAVEAGSGEMLVEAGLMLLAEIAQEQGGTNKALGEEPRTLKATW